MQRVFRLFSSSRNHFVRLVQTRAYINSLGSVRNHGFAKTLHRCIGMAVELVLGNCRFFLPLLQIFPDRLQPCRAFIFLVLHKPQPMLENSANRGKFSSFDEGFGKGITLVGE